MVKEIDIGEFSANPHHYFPDVLEGDIVRVQCQEAGNFMMVEEQEYLIMRDALATIIQLGTTGKLPDEFQQFLSK